MMDTILIVSLVLICIFLAIGNYCQYLKGKIKDSKAWNSENVIDDRQDGESVMHMLLRQMKEIQDND